MKTKLLGDKIRGKIEFLGGEKKTWRWEGKSSYKLGWPKLKYSSTHILLLHKYAMSILYFGFNLDVS
jgi:hypothetical protein